MSRSIAFAALALVTALPSHALTCDELKAQIATKIEAAGVTRFSLTTVDAQADAVGKVVGTCDNGRSKIAYLQTGGLSESAAPSSLPPPAAPGASTPDSVLTECKPGYGGIDCSVQLPAR